MSALRVLLVEDDALNRFVLEVMLRDRRHEVVPAASYAAARGQLQEAGDFDLAILDQRLGDGLGTDLIPALRREHPRIVVALLCGAPEDAPAREADLILTKGDDPAALLSTILERCRAARG